MDVEVVGEVSEVEVERGRVRLNLAVSRRSRTTESWDSNLQRRALLVIAEVDRIGWIARWRKT